MSAHLDLGPPPFAIVARVARFGVVDYCFASDVDDDAAPGALEVLSARGTWEVWSTSKTEPMPLADAIVELVRQKRRDRGGRW